MAERKVLGLGLMDLERMRADLDAWSEHARDALNRHAWAPAFLRYPQLDLRETPAPCVAPPADLRQARIILIGSAGLHMPGQEPFDAGSPRGDYTMRLLPADLDLNHAMIAHEHYRHEAANRDRNVVYPLGRLRELVAAGEIGALTESHIAFMGYQPDYVTLIEQFLPPLVDAALAQQPDAALLVPV